MTRRYTGLAAAGASPSRHIGIPLYPIYRNALDSSLRSHGENIKCGLAPSRRRSHNLFEQASRRNAGSNENDPFQANHRGRAKDQVSCDLGGEAALLHMNKGIYYGLDPVGAESEAAAAAAAGRRNRGSRRAPNMMWSRSAAGAICRRCWRACSKRA